MMYREILPQDVDRVLAAARKESNSATWHSISGRTSFWQHLLSAATFGLSYFHPGSKEFGIYREEVYSAARKAFLNAPASLKLLSHNLALAGLYYRLPGPDEEVTTRAWIITFTGQRFFPFAPHHSSISIIDIAHALSNKCRFSGHTNEFYSVAQHSVLVAQSCPPEIGLDGLLHDAAEAYLGDISRPMKQLPCMAPLREAERVLDLAIRKTFELRDELPDEVHDADKLLLVTEARDLLQTLPPEWRYAESHGYPALPDPIKPLPPSSAKQLFLDEFARYKALRESDQAKGGD
jgi:uncharacterized protein